jgi:hypothetical protein
MEWHEQKWNNDVTSIVFMFLHQTTDNYYFSGRKFCKHIFLELFSERRLSHSTQVSPFCWQWKLWRSHLQFQKIVKTGNCQETEERLLSRPSKIAPPTMMIAVYYCYSFKAKSMSVLCCVLQNVSMLWNKARSITKYVPLKVQQCFWRI